MVAIQSMTTSSRCDGLTSLLVGDIQGFQHVVDAGQAVLRILDQRLRGRVAEAIQEIREEEEALTIVGAVTSGLSDRLVQSVSERSGILGIGEIHAADGVAIQESRHL